MANWEIYAGDLEPPIPLVFTDSNGPFDITTGISQINFIASSGAGGHTISGTAVSLQTTFTATANGNTTLSSVSAFTGLWLPRTPPWATGSPLYCPGTLAAPTGEVGSWTMPTITAWNQGSSTITMSEAALGSGSVTITANLGYAWYVWNSGDTANTGTYTYVGQLIYTSGSKPQTFPSGGQAPLTLQIDALP